MKKLWKLFLEVYYAIHLAHKWHCGFRKVLQFVRADEVMQKQISNIIGGTNDD